MTLILKVSAELRARLLKRTAMTADGCMMEFGLEFDSDDMGIGLI